MINRPNFRYLYRRLICMIGQRVVIGSNKNFTEFRCKIIRSEIAYPAGIMRLRLYTPLKVVNQTFRILPFGVINDKYLEIARYVLIFYYSKKEYSERSVYYLQLPKNKLFIFKSCNNFLE